MRGYRNTAEYARAHKRAGQRLGIPPEYCPTCGKKPLPQRTGRRSMQLSYVGPKTGEDAYDVTGEEYIWECASCNMRRSAHPHTEEHKAKIGAASRGRRQSPEWVARRAASIAARYADGTPHPNKGKKRDPEIGRKISAAKKGNCPKTPAMRQQMSEARKGIPKSEEFKARVSASMKKLRQAQREARAKDVLTYVGGVS